MRKEIEYLRFKIIEPFLRKEKKLKEIEEEKNISYATLKRWVQAYKKDGLLGLEKKTREDKNSFRNVKNSEISQIKKLCLESSETNITKLYEKIKSEISISYATFYRIVNNIDEFFNKDTVFNLNKIKKEDQCYILLDLPIYVFAHDDISNKRTVPKLLVILDVASLEPINFILSATDSNCNILLDFIRETIIKVSIKRGKLTLPQEILVESKNINGKQMLKKIYQELKIKISEYYVENLEIKRFVEFLQNDIHTFYLENNSEITFLQLLEFLNSYLYLSKSQFSFSINYKLSEELNYIRKLDIFLKSTKRKINDYKIRFKNLQYINNGLKNINGDIVDIRYSHLTKEIIYIFKEDNYLFPAFILKQ